MTRWAALCGAALLAAAALRFVGLSYGLPHVFNADEPHLINIAVSFGSGNLEPHSFKYPTLWPTFLFASYGVYFVLWSGFGLSAGVADFMQLFAWDPSGFYLIARAWAAALSLLGAAAAAWAARAWKNDAYWPAAGLLLAAAPTLTESAHSAKPDCAMFFIVSAAWYCGLRLYQDGGRRWHWACGALLGLAFSTQYTAIGAFPLLLAAHAFSPVKPNRRWLAEGAGAIALGFLAGTPYSLLAFAKFRDNLQDFAYLASHAERSQSWVAARVAENLWNFAGEGSLAGFLAAFGLARLALEDRRMAAFLGLPLAAYALFLGTHPDGGWPRYLFGCFPALALLAAHGLRRLAGGRGWAAAALAGLAVVPGLWGSWMYDRELLLDDTRREASAWIESHIAAGSAILLDSPHASPRLSMTREQLEELGRQTLAAGSPRGRLFSAMAARHPGGGYRILRIARTALDLRSNPMHVAQSQADASTLDVSAGLDAARRAGVRYIVTSSHGAKPERAPELAGFFAELCAKGRLLAEFSPRPEASAGPVLRVFQI